MSRDTRRNRKVYDFSKKAGEIKGMIESCLPHAKLFVEYPYTTLLARYYKKNEIAADNHDRYLLSQSRLHADFVLPDFNCVIEVDGEQHFGPVTFGGISEKEAQQNYEGQKHRDQLKHRICVEMEYKLVRIKHNQEVSEEKLFELLREA